MVCNDAGDNDMGTMVSHVDNDDEDLDREDPMATIAVKTMRLGKAGATMWGTMMVSDDPDEVEGATETSSPFFVNGHDSVLDTMIRNKFLKAQNTRSDAVPPLLYREGESASASPGFETLVHRQFFSPSPASSSASASPTTFTRPVHRKTNSASGGQELAPKASSSSEGLVEKAYVDNAVAQLEKRMQQHLTTLVRQEIDKLKDDILQTVARLIPEELPQSLSGNTTPQRFSSGSLSVGSDGDTLRRTPSGKILSTAPSRSEQKKDEKAKKKEGKEKKKAEKEREKEIKKERRKSLSMLKRSGVQPGKSFLA